MAIQRKAKAKSKSAAGGAAKKSSTRKSTRGTRARAAAASSSPPAGAAFGALPTMPNLLTPEQAIEMYKANAAMALDVINAALDGSARLRQKQYEGEAEAHAIRKKAARTVTEARDPQAMMAAGQGVAQEALEKSMRYWSEMFELIVEIQKRLFTMIEDQTAGMPGVNQAKAAIAMLPDLRQMQNVVTALQGVIGSSGGAFESVQRVMGDFARMAQGSIPGIKR